MASEIWVALLAFCGTVIGTGGGIMASSKLISFRLEQLEKRVEEHNNWGKKIPVIEEQIKVANHRIEDLERKVDA